MTLLRSLLDRRRNTALDVENIRAAHACASWLVAYPDDDLVGKLDTIAQLASGLDARVGEPITRAAEELASGDIISLREKYVDTFDTRRRGCLYLTYYSNGDTRRRGMALVRIKDAYRRAGLFVDNDELPDHLALVLEFSAGTSIDGGMKILTQNRPGIELLRVHLESISSPWHGAIQAVCATLPTLSNTDMESMAELAAHGPEEELVGLDGYGDDHFDQIYPASRPGPTFCGSDETIAPEVPAGMTQLPLGRS